MLALVPFMVLALQVTASQSAGVAQSGARIEVPDPMQIEVSLGADKDPRGNPRPPFDQVPVGKTRGYPETDRFVCDRARVRMLGVKKVSETAEEVVIEAGLTLLSDWPLQDVDLTVALVAKDGTVLGQRTWDDLTLGPWSHSYTPPKVEFKVTASRWKELFADGIAPLMRITVDVQE